MLDKEVLELITSGGGNVVLAIIAIVLWNKVGKLAAEAERMAKEIGSLSARLKDCIKANNTVTPSRKKKT